MHTIKIASTLRKAIENCRGYPREKGCKNCTAEEYPQGDGFWCRCPAKF